MMYQLLQKTAYSVACLTITCGAAFAQAPYYFVDGFSNRWPVFTDSGCTGQAVDQCNVLSDQCSIRIYTDNTGLRQARAMFPNEVYIRDRADLSVACTITGQ